MTTQQPAVRPEATPRIDAVIDVGGDFSGQIAVGQDIVQLKNVQIHVQPGGALVAAPTGPVEVRRRRRPVRARGRRPRVYVDRADERASAAQAAAEHDVLAFTGPPGSGKSALLRELAHELTHGREDLEVVLLAGAERPVDDVLNDVFQLLHETDRPYVAVGSALRGHLQDFDGVVLVDDAASGQRDLTDLLDALPGSAILLSGQAFPGDVRSMALAPLPETDRRALVGVLGAGTEAIAASPSGLPGDLVLAARASAAASSSGGQFPPNRPPDEEERRALDVLAAAGPAGLSRALLAVAAGSGDAVDRLAMRGLAEEDDENGVAIVVAPSAVLVPAVEGAPAHIDGLRRLLGAVASQPVDAGKGRPTRDLSAGAGAVLAGAQHGLWAEVAAAGPVIETRLLATGRWSQWSQVLRATLQAAREQGDQALEAYALHQLGTWALCSGNPVSARSWLEEAHELRRSIGDEQGLQVTEANLTWLRTVANGGPTGGQGSRRGGLRGRLPWRIALWSLAVIAVTATAVAVGAAVRPGPDEPRLDASPGVLDLGEVTLGTEARATFAVRNTGDGTASAVAVHARPAAFSARSQCPDLEPNTSCDVTVRFRPAAAGEQSGHVVVLLDGVPAADVRVRGVGVLPPIPTGLTVTPEVLDFGPQPVGTVSEPRRIEIALSADLRPREPTIAGPHTEHFTVVRDSCSGHHGSGTCAVAVVYAPQAAGRSVATLSLPIEGHEPLRIPLTGDGVAGGTSVLLDPATVSLGPVALGDSTRTTIELRNHGQSPVTVVNRLLSGSTPGDFRVSGCTEPLPAGATCTMSIAFRPGDAGLRAALLTVHLADGDDLSASLVGEGVTAADTEPPQLFLTSLTAEAESAKGALVRYQATARDKVDGSVPVDCDRATGDEFPLGETSVSCTATDVAGNIGSGTFVVRVEDTAGPKVTVPVEITRTVDWSTDTIVIRWPSAATDLVDGAVKVSCSPPSPSTFTTTGPVKPSPTSPEKPHTVTCTARDQAGNTGTASFPVHVLFRNVPVE